MKKVSDLDLNTTIGNISIPTIILLKMNKMS